MAMSVRILPGTESRPFIVTKNLTVRTVNRLTKGRKESLRYHGSSNCRRELVPYQNPEAWRRGPTGLDHRPLRTALSLSSRRGAGALGHSSQCCGHLGQVLVTKVIRLVV